MQTWNLTCDTTDECYELVSHPPYSPDVTRTDYFLFPRPKKWLAEKRFQSTDEFKKETNFSFEGLEFHTIGPDITLDGNYVFKWTVAIIIAIFFITLSMLSHDYDQDINLKI